MNRREFLSSLLAIALPVAPILATVAMPKIIKVSPYGDITLRQAIKIADPGDIILLSAGIYQGIFEIPNGVNLLGSETT